MRKCSIIIHIGGQKTGSTSFQKHLLLNQAQMERSGIGTFNCFYDELGSHNKIADYVETHPLPYVQLGYEASSRTEKTLILTSELLCHLDVRKLQSLSNLAEIYNITWLFVRRNPIEILLSHWADRVSRYGDTISFSNYVDVRVHTPWMPGRYPFSDKYFTGDLDLKVLGDKFHNLPGLKTYANYNTNVVNDLLEYVGISRPGDTTARIGKSPGIGSVLLIREVIATNILKLGRVSYSDLMQCARYLTAYLAEFDQTPSPTKLPMPSSILSRHPFLMDSQNYLEKLYGWENLNQSYIWPQEYEQKIDVENGESEEISAIYLEELKNKVDQEYLNYKVHQLLSKK